MYDRATSEAVLHVDGEWWLPGSSRKKVKGTLDISVSDGGRLKLFDHLPGRGISEIDYLGESYKPDIINGMSNRGERITLLDCRETVGGVESEYTADKVITDWHVKKREAIRFDKFAMRFSDLEEWLDIRQIELKRNSETQSPRIESRELEVKEYTVQKGMKISIESVCYIEEFTYVQTSASMVQRACFVLETEKEKALDELLEIGKRIRMLLCLGSQKPIYRDVITAYSKRNMRARRDGGRYAKPMNIYVKQMQRFEKRDKSAWNRGLFTYKQIEGSFGDVLVNLLNKYEILKPLFESYLPWYYLERSYLEFRFLALLIGLERYHRMRYEGYERSKNEHKTMVREILDAVPDQHRLWLKNKLEYSNEISLRDRMRELVEESKMVLVGIYGDKNEIISRTAHTRNYLVHGGEYLKHRAKTPQELWELMMALETIVDACLLRELGVPNTTARELLTETRKISKV
jgi:hypothetical protein